MRIAFPVLLLTLGTHVAAQSPVASSPPGFLSIEGALMPGIGVNLTRACLYFGSHPDYETQIFDAHLRGKGSRLIKQLDYRADFRSHTGNLSEGRTWKSVTLRMSDGKYDGNISTTFSLNPTGSQTTVFSGSVTWPTIVGFPHPGGPPNPWGTQVKFPFRQNWMTTNVADILQHFKFAGGSLASGTSWTQNRARSYFLDAEFNSVAGTGFRHYYHSRDPGCTDSAQTFTGLASMYAQTFAKQAFDPVNNGRLRIETGLYAAAPNQPTILAYSLAAADITFPGVSCQKLGIDPKSMLLFPRTANGIGKAEILLSWPYNPILANARLYMQGAWNDSAKGNVMLSWQSFIQAAKQPLGKMRVLYQAGTTKAVISCAMQRIPLTRYTFQ